MDSRCIFLVFSALFQVFSALSKHKGKHKSESKEVGKRNVNINLKHYLVREHFGPSQIDASIQIDFHLQLWLLNNEGNNFQDPRLLHSIIILLLF